MLHASVVVGICFAYFKSRCCGIMPVRRIWSGAVYLQFCAPHGDVMTDRLLTRKPDINWHTGSLKHLRAEVVEQYRMCPIDTYRALIKSLSTWHC